MGIYQHYREEEHPFINQVLSWKEDVERSYRAKLTDFLDPREQQIVATLIGVTNESILFKFYGGGSYPERKRAMIAPFYEEIMEEDFQLTLLQADYNKKFLSLSHPDALGAFLSLGITRSKLGDISVTDETIQMIVAEDIADYVKANLTSVKNATIKLSERPFTSLLEKELNWSEEERTVSSLRLDVVLKEIYRLSRKDASSFIAQKNVKVNFRTVEQAAYTLYEGDLLSVRGKGRSKLMTINGRTRKDKYRITIGLLK